MPSIALVYDRVNTPFGGAEHVLLALHQTFPDAPLFTSVYDAQTAQWADVFEVRPSFLQRLFFARARHQLLAPLMPLAFESLDLSQFDIIISITSAEAKGIITQPHQLHICYLLTPTRYLYSHRSDYQKTSWLRLPIIRQLGQQALKYLTWWDQAASARPDVLIPISKRVGERARIYYKREPAAVIYPPIPAVTQIKQQTESLLPPDLINQPFALVISRLVDYKRIDLAIQACENSGLPLVIVGSGAEEVRLKQLASSSQTFFLGSLPELQKNTLLQACTVFLMPGVEDFGITALEAARLGKTVILHSESGAAELLPEKSGAIHLRELTVKSLILALKQASNFHPDLSRIKKNLRDCAITNFRQRFQEAVFAFWHAHQNERNS